eukprot:g3712.t1
MPDSKLPSFPSRGYTVVDPSEAISPEASLGPRPRSASTSRGVRSAQQAVRPVAARQPAARADAVTSTAFSRATTPGVHPLCEGGVSGAADLPSVGHGARTGPSSKEEAFPRQADVKSPSTVRQSEAPHRPVSQRTSAAPRPNRCWAGSQADSSAAEAAIPEERAATASARPGGRRPLPPTSGSSGPTGLGPQKSSSRPSSAKGQSADPGGGSRKSLPAGGPLGGRSAYAYRGAAAAAAAAMEDSSRDGVLSEAEMLNLLEILSVPRREAQALFKEADANRDGQIQVHEFISWLMRTPALLASATSSATS